MKTMTASNLVALRKDAHDGVRPTAVPSIWKKLAALPLKTTVYWTERLDKEMRNVFTRITDVLVQPDCAAFSYPP
eukprot:1246462-Amphidinium_carterae.1